VGENPTRQPLQPEATGAAMEMAEAFVGPVRLCRIGHGMSWVKA
jgi:hypothetical protein